MNGNNNGNNNPAPAPASTTTTGILKNSLPQVPAEDLVLPRHQQASRFEEAARQGAAAAALYEGAGMDMMGEGDGRGRGRGRGTGAGVGLLNSVPRDPVVATREQEGRRHLVRGAVGRSTDVVGNTVWNRMEDNVTRSLTQSDGGSGLGVAEQEELSHENEAERRRRVAVDVGFNPP